MRVTVCELSNEPQQLARGWIGEPKEADILAVTSAAQPFVTLDIDPGIADKAQQTYPRYVMDGG